MRQKHRKAIYLVLASIIAVVYAPFYLIAIVTTWICNRIYDLCDILKYLLRIFDEDKAPAKTNKK